MDEGSKHEDSFFEANIQPPVKKAEVASLPSECGEEVVEDFEVLEKEEYSLVSDIQPITSEELQSTETSNECPLGKVISK